MAAGGLPTVQVLLDDGTGTFPYDISSKCRIGYDLNRGRQDEQSDVTPGAIRSLVLDNTDGRFTLNSTIIASPSPIRPDNRIRVKVTPSGGTTRNRFTGYAQEWPTIWPDGSDLLCEVTLAATDAQARAERRALLSVIEEEINLDGANALYILNEPQGSTSASDSSGAQQTPLTMVGSGTDVVFGSATGPATDGYTGATFAAGKYLRTTLAFASAPTTLAIGFFFTASAFLAPILRLTPVGAGSVAPILYTTGTGKVGITDGIVSVQNPSVTVTDGAVHHAMLLITATTVAIYVDGVSMAPSAALTVPLAANMVLELGGADFVPNATYGTTFTPLTTGMAGSLEHLTAFTAAPSAARIAAQANAGLNGFAGESDTARLIRTAGYADVPVGSLDTSLSNVAFAEIGGTSAGDQIRACSDAAVGVVFVDGSGNYTMFNRQRPTTKLSPDITLTADQVVDPDLGVPVDMQGVLNYFAGTAAGGSQRPQVARNVVSELGDGTVTNPGHGRYSGSQTFMVQTDAEALDRANWIVGNHAEPLPRIPVLKLDLLTLDAATQNALLAAEADTWIRITGLPAQTPGGTTADLLVQGFTEHMAPDAWDLTFNVVAMSMFRAWILGDTTWGVLGSTTRLGV